MRIGNFGASDNGAFFWVVFGFFVVVEGGLLFEVLFEPQVITLFIEGPLVVQEVLVQDELSLGQQDKS